MPYITEIINKSFDGIPKRSIVNRFSEHLLSQLVCLGRHTITGLLCASGKQFMDWSADYRLYSKDRIDIERLFNTVLTDILSYPSSAPLVLALDDTLLPKTGRKIPGVKYARDPMGPPFHVNLIRGQRIVQISVAMTAKDGSARMIPVMFKDAFVAPRPRRKAPPEAWMLYQEQKRRTCLSVYGANALHDLRAKIAALSPSRPVWVAVDGGYTNKNILRHLPPQTVFIGRIRSDAKLFLPPTPNTQDTKAGRTRLYGERIPTPEQLRHDPAIPWREIEAFAAGKKHLFKVKCIDNLRSPMTGDNNNRLIIIAPLAYRPSQCGKRSFRLPSYIICTDQNPSLERIIQAYFWRWDIEVNFRDEKTLLGVGQAQVRNQKSVSALPQMAIAAYAVLLLASAKAFGINGIPDALPQPKWRSSAPKRRGSTQDMIRQLRWELWAIGMNIDNLKGFVNFEVNVMNHEKLLNNLSGAVYYALK